MINPHLLTPKSKRWNDPHFAGGKIYLAVMVPAGVRSRRVFKRAGEAQDHAKRVHARWCRLYDAAIVEMIAPAPALQEA